MEQATDGWDIRRRLEAELTTGFAANLIRQKVRRMAERLELCRADEEDLAQDLRLDLLRRSSRYQAERSEWRVFACVVVDRSARSAWRKRTKRPWTSLIDGSVLGQDVETGDLDRRIRGGTVDRASQRVLRLDVRELLSALSADDRDLCQRLSNGGLSDVARELGIPRSTLQDRVIRLRRKLAALSPASSSQISP